MQSLNKFMLINIGSVVAFEYPLILSQEANDFLAKWHEKKQSSFQ